MPLMELHKHHRDVFGVDLPDSHAPKVTLDSGEQAEVVVELVSEAPDEHVFSKPYVDRETAKGWLAFEGQPVEYEVHPDPNGPMKEASNLTLTLPGDHLVMRVVKDGKPVEVVYRITHLPVPQFFRLEDESEEHGVRIAPEFGLALAEVRG